MPKNAKSDPTVLVLRNVRLSYPHLDEPYAGENDDGNAVAKYTAKLITCPKDPEFKGNIKRVKAAVEAALEEKFGSNPPKIAKDRRFYVKIDGDMDGYEDFIGCYRFGGNSKTRPTLVSRFRDPKTGKPQMVAEEDIADVFYPGCRVNAVLKVWCQSNKFGKRINAFLDAVQFHKDDTPLGRSSIDPEDVFAFEDAPEEEFDMGNDEFDEEFDGQKKGRDHDEFEDDDDDIL